MNETTNNQRPTTRGFTPTPIAGDIKRSLSGVSDAISFGRSRATPDAIDVRPHRGRGFTLVEMIVAVSIFTVVTFVAVGALLAITDANRKANALRTTMDNLNFAMESMARNIRTGTGYSNGGNSFSFDDQDDIVTTYSLSTANDIGSIIVQKAGEPDPIAITSPEVDIDTLNFYVAGISVGDDVQPRVVITLKGTAGKIAKLRTTFSLQTTISQRKLDQ